MHYYEVAPNKIIRPGQNTFTYHSESVLLRGHIVLIQAGKRTVIGVVTEKVQKPTYATKPITSVVNNTPLPSEIVDLSLWLSSYYATPLASVLQTALPSGILKERRKSITSPQENIRSRTTIVFNDEQLFAIETISKGSQGTYLLQGITGSGKTEIYKEIARTMIQQNKSVIMLTPEIGLTPQLIGEFAHDFEDIIVTHSTMSEAKRHLSWQSALSSADARVVIGPRSALFTPLKNIGAIIIDEAHEPSYKQDQSPRYSALRAASILAKLHGAKLILGSATPNVTDRYIAEQTGRPVIKLSKIARPGSVLPRVELVDMTKRQSFTRHRFLSNQLLDSIEESIAQGKQTLVFHNRRGSASSTLCENCGWAALCPRCFIPLTLHTDAYELRCHVCDHHEKVPSSCPVCHHANIIHKGIGTKLVESELGKIFPKATIMRFDSDTKDADSLTNNYDKLYNGEVTIAIGTQMIAKGLDLPDLRTVGIIQADSGLSLPDFTSDERTFQLISQVIGRVGRTKNPSEVVVQSYQVTHPSVTFGIKQDYESFFKESLVKRQHGLFPPFVYLLKLTCAYKTESGAIKAARDLASTLKVNLPTSVHVLGPTPAFYERQRDTYRWQLTLKSTNRDHLVEALSFVPSTHWQFDLDPSSLL
jgi:primosomal protein N' (replication factor Y)